MKNLNNMGFDPKIYNDILEKFEKIKFDAGIEPDEESQKELEELFGVDLEDFEDLDDEFFKNSQTRTIEVELTHKDAVFPKYAYLSDSGFDLHSTQDLEIKPFGRILVPTGIKVSFEKGYELQIRSKSGLSLNQGLMVLNSPGTVDCFSEDMKILTIDGDKTIKELRIGDIVYSFNEDSLEIEKDVVTSIFDTEVQEILLIDTEHGILEVTLNSEVYTKNGIKLAKNLTENDEIIIF